MTEISSVTAPPASGGPTLAPPPSAEKLISSDFTTFLKMLTTQLQNQDPLDPMDNSEYAAQLATFSGVEQQVKTNTLLEALATQMGIAGLSQYAAWVGKDGRAAMPVWFQGQSVTLSAQPDPLADRAELVVTDAAGTEVARQQIVLGEPTFSWTGTDASGAALPAGRYSFAVESFAEGARIATAPVEAYARIIEARGGATPSLVFAGGIEVPATAVTALRGG